jgi:ATP-dependent DNA helicase DinG
MLAASEHPRPSTLSCDVLCAGAKDFAYLNQHGELKTLNAAQAALACGARPLLVCHWPYTRQRMNNPDIDAIDVLELFAFVHPARFCVPTPAGLAKSLGHTVPDSMEDYPFSLLESVQCLLDDLSGHPQKDMLLSIAEVMGLNGRGWAWTPHVFAALGETYDPQKAVNSRTMLNVWKNLPEWAEDAPPPPPGHLPVSGDESREKLGDVLARSPHAESRAPQMNYTTRLSEAFQPKTDPEQPLVVVAEAGTGVGKTLGYLTPATLWADKNQGSVWISTYTKNLQRQIEGELARLYPDPDLRDRKIAVRKGRENYLCLLNFEDVAAGAGLAKHISTAVSAGLMARWIMQSRDGDLSGTDFPGWLPGLLGRAHTTGLADQRGECIYSACDHYHRCFVERAIRKAKHMPVVIANHAVVMTQTFMSGPDDDLPHRYIFDEGHHLFDAADSTFAAHLTGQDTHDLRRWIIGPEGGRKSRARGLRKRIEDLLAGDDEGLAILQDITHHARFLPGDDWLKRLKQNTPGGSAEDFLALVLQQVNARAEGRNSPYSIETPVLPLLDGIVGKSAELKDHLKSLRSPMLRLSAHLRQRLVEQADTLSSDSRKRFDAVAQSLDRRAANMMTAWIDMLESLQNPLPSPDAVDWFEIEKIEGQMFNLGLYRHYRDPVKPFAAALRPHAHSVAITSATLRDSADAHEDFAGWDAALSMTGAGALADAPVTFSIPSPFDYANRTRVFVVNDVRKDDMDQLASAYRTLFTASSGGGLGLFTSIQRLKAVHQRIHNSLAQAGLSLFSQHVDGIDVGTLVDMFRDDTHSCLLGTDAVRDGVDVPGDSLRLIVFDRVPWPRATLLHKARREQFGKSAYDDRLTRLKLKQAYGRLIRRATDKGVFVCLDGMFPSRLLSAFPGDVQMERAGLADTAAKIKTFLAG